MSHAENIELQKSLKAMVGDKNAVAVRSLDLALDAFFNSFEAINDVEWKSKTRMQLLSCLNRVCGTEASDTHRAQVIGKELHRILDHAIALGHSVPAGALVLAMHAAGREDLHFHWNHQERRDTLILINTATGVGHYQVTVKGDPAKHRSAWLYMARSQRRMDRRVGFFSLEEAKLYVYKSLASYMHGQPMTVDMNSDDISPIAPASIFTRIWRLMKPA